MFKKATKDQDKKQDDESSTDDPEPPAIGGLGRISAGIAKGGGDEDQKNYFAWRGRTKSIDSHTFYAAHDDGEVYRGVSLEGYGSQGYRSVHSSSALASMSSGGSGTGVGLKLGSKSYSAYAKTDPAEVDEDFQKYFVSYKSPLTKKKVADDAILGWFSVLSSKVVKYTSLPDVPKVLNTQTCWFFHTHDVAVPVRQLLSSLERIVKKNLFQVSFALKSDDKLAAGVNKLNSLYVSGSVSVVSRSQVHHHSNLFEFHVFGAQFKNLRPGTGCLIEFQARMGDRMLLHELFVEVERQITLQLDVHHIDDNGNLFMKKPPLAILASVPSSPVKSSKKVPEYRADPLDVLDMCLQRDAGSPIESVDKFELIFEITADAADDTVDPFDIFFDEECKVNSNLLGLYDLLLDGFEEVFSVLESAFANLNSVAPVAQLLCKIFSNLSAIKPIRDSLVDPVIVWTLIKMLQTCAVLKSKSDASSTLSKIAEAIYLYFENVGKSHSSRLRSVLMDSEVKSCLNEAAAVASSCGGSSSTMPCVKYLMDLCC
eukprot:TRINITY_DN2751_c0_g1_i1.p1 TRINITY_DN2751_c0_g1~~TRINITY_DN2751_c0_g1_i1.p1  ORF type:complete len:541 (-),score=139.47 TRINITY_DN2751_c0_g1_i1:87-1709(-)